MEKMGSCCTILIWRKVVHSILACFWEAYCAVLFGLLSLPLAVSALDCGNNESGKKVGSSSIIFCLTHMVFAFYLVIELRLEVKYGSKEWNCPGQLPFIITKLNNSKQTTSESCCSMSEVKDSPDKRRLLNLLCLLCVFGLSQLTYFFVTVDTPATLKEFLSRESVTLPRHIAMELIAAAVIDYLAICVLFVQVVSPANVRALVGQP